VEVIGEARKRRSTRELQEGSRVGGLPGLEGTREGREEVGFLGSVEGMRVVEVESTFVEVVGRRLVVMLGCVEGIEVGQAVVED
jgi:hypothetical protein